MKLDLRKQIAPITADIVRHFRDFQPGTQEGPGEPDDPIRQIVACYQVDEDDVWIALILNTRPDADPISDESWLDYVDENLLDSDLEVWGDACEEIFENGTRVSFLSVDEVVTRLGPIDEADEDQIGFELSELFGGVVREALLAAHRKNAFARLPLADDCVLRIDDYKGHYVWPDPETRGTEADEGLLQR